MPNNAPEYVPGNDDVGRRIMFKYTPINSYGKAGETITVTSDPVKPGKRPGFVASYLFSNRFACSGVWHGRFAVYY